MMDATDDHNDSPRPFLDHLGDLRRTLLGALGILALAVAVAVPLAPRLFTLLKRPLRGVVPDPEHFLASYEVAAGFMVLLRVAFSAGLVLAAPWILWLAARFVFPGLTGLERKIARRYAALAVVMFFAGAGFAYAVILPLALRVMLGMHAWMGITVVNVLATSYIAFVAQMLLGFGLAFEMPVVLLAFGQMGIVSAARLRACRRHVWVAVFIVAMLMTPQDVATQILMALPLIILFEGCILLIARHEKRAGNGRSPR